MGAWARLGRSKGTTFTFTAQGIKWKKRMRVYLQAQQKKNQITHLSAYT
jgi:hypothetical protein